MKNFNLFLIAFFTLSTSAQAAEITFSNFGAVFLRDTVNTSEFKKSVGALSIEVLQRSGMDYDANENYIQRIGSFGSVTSTVDGVWRGFGWCYTVNGKLPNVWADDFFLSADSDHVDWYYGYVDYVEGSPDQSEICHPVTSPIQIQ